MDPFRIENAWVLGLLLVAALVGLGGRWRDDPGHAGTAKRINCAIKVGFALLVGAVALLLGLVLLLRPIGP
jgi:hypothetical protein